jgi:hypothetical protein
MNEFRKAERKKAKLRLGLVGPAGSGKTYSALQVAFGLGGKVALIDTENGSGDLYAHLGEYDVCTLEAPYTVQKYLSAIEQAERAGYDTIIIDSLTHAWAGDGGLLDQQGKIADSSRNSYTAWRTVTPLHYKLIDAMLTSRCHIIATMRSKTEYVLQDNEYGKKVPVKIGMAPVQREGMDYEFTLVFDLDTKHNATASKDRTSIFDGQVFALSAKTGETLREWLENGVDVPAGPSRTPQDESLTVAGANTPPSPQNNAQKSSVKERKEKIWNGFLDICDAQPDHAKNAILLVTSGRGSKDWTEEDMINLELDLKQRQEKRAKELERLNWTYEPESARDANPDIDDDAATVMGIGPDPEPQTEEEPPQEEKKLKAPKNFSEVDKLRMKVETAFGPEGLGYTVQEREAWIEKFFKVPGLKDLSKSDLKKVLTLAQQEIKSRDAAELGGVA